MVPLPVYVYTRFLYPKPVANGESWFHVGATVLVDGENAFVDESCISAPDTELSSKEVLVIAVNGVVFGVNVVPLGYKQVPFSNRKLVIYPRYGWVGYSPAVPIASLYAESFMVPDTLAVTT